MANHKLRFASRTARIAFRFLATASVPIAALAAAQEQTLPDTVVTATRIETPIEQVGSSVTLITADELERRQIHVVSDVLRDVPSVAVNRSGVVGNQTEVRIRGAASNQSLVVIDGVRVNNPNGSGFDFNGLLNLGIERIEVLRGPSSVLWGSDAIGGVVNIVTKRAERPFQASLAVEGGSFGTGQVLGSVGSRGDQYDVLVSGTYFDTRGESSGSELRGNRERDASRIGALNLKAGLRPADNLELNLVGSYSEDSTEFDDFVGGTEMPVVDADNDVDKTESSLRAEGKLTLLDDTWEHIVSAGLYKIDTDTRFEFADNTASEGRTNQAYYQTNYYFDTPEFGSGEHAVTFLADYKEDESENSFFAKRSIRNNAYALNYNAGFNDSLFFTGGIRYDDNDRFDNTDTYRLTGAYIQRDWGTRFHGSYGKAVKNPTLTELFGFFGDFRGNPDLQPETGFGWDLGIEQSLSEGRFKGDVTYFNSRIEDLIVGAGNTVENLNGNSKAQGVEVSVRAMLLDGLDLTASYTYTETEDPDGDELVRRPKNLASLIFNYAFVGGRANTNLAIRYNGSQNDYAFDSLTFERSQVTLDAFTIVDLNGSYKINEYLDVVGRVENLLDEKYEEVFGYGSVRRGFYVGLKAAL